MKLTFSKIKTYSLFWISSIIVLVLDQVTKYWISHSIPFPSYRYDDPNVITVIPNFFHIVHVGNEGAAWGMFHGFGIWLAFFAVASLSVIYYFRHQLSLKKKFPQFVFGIMIGGIIGNLIDRIVIGHVIDFLDFNLPIYGRFPSFNVADIGICCGVFGYIIFTYFFDEDSKKKKQEENGNEATENKTA